jgi:hypothetical protein
MNSLPEKPDALARENVIDAGYGLRGGRFLGSGAGCSFHCA